MKLTKKVVNDTLNSCKWNVREDKTLIMIAESDNPDYFEEQARLLIRDCTNNRRLDCAEEYTDKIKQSIQLLTLALIYHDKIHPVDK